MKDICLTADNIPWTSITCFRKTYNIWKRLHSLKYNKITTWKGHKSQGVCGENELFKMVGVMENKTTNYCSKNEETQQICHPLHRQNLKCKWHLVPQGSRDKHPGMRLGKTLQGWQCWEIPWGFSCLLCLGSRETCALAREIKLAARGRLTHF